jgi:mRNA interferase RelE/StbE
MLNIELKPRALSDLAALSKADQQKIRDRINALANGDTRDIKKLVSFQPPFRLRVGNYRLLMEIQGNRVTIYRIKHRREAYR